MAVMPFDPALTGDTLTLEMIDEAVEKAKQWPIIPTQHLRSQIISQNEANERAWESVCKMVRIPPALMPTGTGAPSDPIGHGRSGSPTALHTSSRQNGTH